MEIAIQTPQQHTSFSRLRDIWQAADELGFSAAFTFDHFVPYSPHARSDQPETVPAGPQLEGWATLTALSPATRYLDVGTLVSGVNYRHPVVLTKMVVTLDHITGGRALLGLGAGGYEPDQTMYNFNHPILADRMEMLEETLEAFKLLCSADDPAYYRGRFLQLDGAHFDPKPVRQGGVPVIVGGNGKRLRRIAARHADWYNGFWAPWQWAEINDDLNMLLAQTGRRTEDLKRTVFVFSELSGDPATTEVLVKVIQSTHRGDTTEQARSRIIAGTPEHMISVLKSYSAAGVDMAILNIRPTQGVPELESFSANVLPSITHLHTGKYQASHTVYPG